MVRGARLRVLGLVQIRDSGRARLHERGEVGRGLVGNEARSREVLPVRQHVLHVVAVLGHELGIGALDLGCVGDDVLFVVGEDARDHGADGLDCEILDRRLHRLGEGRGLEGAVLVEEAESEGVRIGRATHHAREGAAEVDDHGVAVLEQVADLRRGGLDQLAREILRIHHVAFGTVVVELDVGGAGAHAAAHELDIHDAEERGGLDDPRRDLHGFHLDGAAVEGLVQEPVGLGEVLVALTHQAVEEAHVAAVDGGVRELLADARVGGHDQAGGVLRLLRRDEALGLRRDEGEERRQLGRDLGLDVRVMGGRDDLPPPETIFSGVPDLELELRTERRAGRFAHSDILLSDT